MKTAITITLFLLFLLTHVGWSQSVVTYDDQKMRIGQHTEILEDRTSSLSLEDVISSNAFIPSNRMVPNLGITPHAYWVKFKVANVNETHNIGVQVAYAMIDSISFYQINEGVITYENHSGGMSPFYTRRLNEHQFFFYQLNMGINDTVTCYMRVKSGSQLMLPIDIGSRHQLVGDLMKKDLLFGIYLGIIFVMIFYNGFVYLTLRDKHYLWYILYLLTVLFTQASLEGYTFRFLLPNQPYWATLNIYISSALIGVTAIAFAKRFLNSKVLAPNLYRLSFLFYGIYSLSIILPFFGYYNLSYQIILLSAALSGIYVFTMALTILLKGSRPARYFLIAWSIFIVGVVIYVLKDFGVLPYNFFTSSALLFGSAVEAVLLSLALADKINMYREEKEAYQETAYQAVRENERIVREQNTILEEQVESRTRELRITNTDLKQALVDLKEAEMQLVESEKMASLGQLTAGIAHEINNPINFVTSNVNPLKRDIQMLQTLLANIENIVAQPISVEEKLEKITSWKEEADYEYLNIEIEHLLKGIQEGATRTSEIVKGLRLFSRLDEDDLKYADIHDGLESTLAITNHLLNGKITLEKKYGEIPLVECYPGKLNQVFLNIINNAIQAVEERWGTQVGGKIEIGTYLDGETVRISISDNGSGMSEATQKRLFEPFFTTKDVGVGTGLGLSIGWNIIKKHNGDIQVDSIIGEGSKFTLSIPVRFQTPKSE